MKGSNTEHKPSGTLLKGEPYELYLQRVARILPASIYAKEPRPSTVKNRPEWDDRFSVETKEVTDMVVPKPPVPRPPRAQRSVEERPFLPRMPETARPVRRLSLFALRTHAAVTDESEETVAEEFIRTQPKVIRRANAGSLESTPAPTPPLTNVGPAIAASPSSVQATTGQYRPTPPQRANFTLDTHELSFRESRTERKSSVFAPTVPQGKKFNYTRHLIEEGRQEERDDTELFQLNRRLSTAEKRARGIEAARTARNYTPEELRNGLRPNNNDQLLPMFEGQGEPGLPESNSFVDLTARSRRPTAQFIYR